MGRGTKGQAGAQGQAALIAGRHARTRTPSPSDLAQRPLSAASPSAGTLAIAGRPRRRPSRRPPRARWRRRERRPPPASRLNASAAPAATPAGAPTRAPRAPSHWNHCPIAAWSSSSSCPLASAATTTERKTCSARCPSCPAAPLRRRRRRQHGRWRQAAAAPAKAPARSTPSARRRARPGSAPACRLRPSPHRAAPPVSRRSPSALGATARVCPYDSADVVLSREIYKFSGFELRGNTLGW